MISNMRHVAMFTHRSKGSNSGNDPIMAVAIPSFGTRQAAAVYEYQRRPGDEVTPLIPVSDVITGDYDGKDGAPVFRDVPFALLFLIHFCIMLWLGIFVAPVGYEQLDFNFTVIEDEIQKNGDNSTTDEDIQSMEIFAEELSDFVQVYPYRIVIYLILPSLLVSFTCIFLDSDGHQDLYLIRSLLFTLL